MRRSSVTAIAIATLVALALAAAATAEDRPEATVGRPDADALRRRANALRATSESPSGDLSALLELDDEALRLPPGAERRALRLHIARSLELREPGAAEARYTGLAAEAGAAGDQRTQSYALGHLAGILEARGEREAARVGTRRALLLAAAAEAPESLYRWQWQLARIERAAGNDAAALHALAQAIDTLLPLRAGAGDARSDFDEAVSPVFRDYVDMLIARASRSDDEAARQRDLRLARQTLESLKRAELRDYFRDDCLDEKTVVSPDQVAGALVIYPVILRDRLELLTASEGTLKSTRVEVEGPTFEKSIRRLRRQLETRTTFGYRKPARQLYRWLIEPIEAELAAHAESTLVFVPDGALRTVPMAALLDPETNRYLIERFPTAITPGLTLTEPRPIASRSARLLAAGLSEGRPGFSALRHVPEELSRLSALFETEQLLDSAFSARALREQLEQRAFDLVHIATHGTFSADTAESFVLTHEGKLHMNALASALATTRFRDRAIELLTLSACESAAGDDRAALGLAGLAVRSGARSALASLWSVHDEATSQLMHAFYSALSVPGTSRARALQHAQRYVLEETPYRHPVYWAPFLLISNWL